MKHTTFLGSLATLAASFTTVAAHGYVNNGIIGDTAFTGYQPYSDPYYVPPPERIIRAVPGNGPITDMTLIDVQCNGYTAGGVIGSEPAPLYVTAAAGAPVFLQWTEWPDSHFGPVITYMAKVPSGKDITTWLPGTDAVWFKVDEAGLYADGTWATISGLIAANSTWTFTIPAQLAPGQYIIRHGKSRSLHVMHSRILTFFEHFSELIALHSSYTYPGAQVYPSCIQVQVTGSGTVTPSGANLVAFPGAYTSTTPGLVYDIWNPNSLSTVPYPIPGPPLYFGGSAPTTEPKSTTITAKSTIGTSGPTTSSTSVKVTTTSTTSSQVAVTTISSKTTTTSSKTTTTAASSTSVGAAYAHGFIRLDGPNYVCNWL
ncbi:Esterase/lipase/thioesterase [Tulasnella sp. 330]|nr:Esterase/lipase/thioesterase [Tulasnella sp. 330]